MAAGVKEIRVIDMCKYKIHAALAVLVLLEIFLYGCSSPNAVATPLDGHVFEVQSKLYVVGYRKDRRNPWYLGTPSSVGLDGRLIREYEYNMDKQAKNEVSKIYGELNTGDLIRIDGSHWVNAGSAFSGYVSKVVILTGEFKGARLRLEGILLSGYTNKPVEHWDPYAEPFPNPVSWKLDDKYLRPVATQVKE